MFHASEQWPLPDILPVIKNTLTLACDGGAAIRCCWAYVVRCAQCLRVCVCEELTRCHLPDVAPHTHSHTHTHVVVFVNVVVGVAIILLRGLWRQNSLMCHHQTTYILLHICTYIYPFDIPHTSYLCYICSVSCVWETIAAEVWPSALQIIINEHTIHRYMCIWYRHDAHMRTHDRLWRKHGERIYVSQCPFVVQHPVDGGGVSLLFEFHKRYMFFASN